MIYQPIPAGLTESIRALYVGRPTCEPTGYDYYHKTTSTITITSTTTKQQQIEGADDSAYLCQVNFYRSPPFNNFLSSHVWTVPGNMHVKFEVRSFNRFGSIGN